MDKQKETKNFKIKLEFDLSTRKNESYANDISVFQNKVEKTLVCDISCSKDDVYDEVKNHFQNALKELSTFLKKRSVTEIQDDSELF